MSVRRNSAALLGFPDFARGWILPATRTARALLDRYSFDAVVSSGPPHSAHVAGVLACGLKYGILTLDMRDPWAGLIEKEWPELGYTSNVARRMTRRLERMIFRRARSIVTNTEEHAAHVRRTYPSARVAFISNGIDYERLPTPTGDKFDGLSLVHAGTLYLGRDLSPVIIGMRQFLEKYPGARGALRLRLAGSMEAGLESKFRGEVAAANLQEAVETFGHVSRHEAMELINRSHLTLVLAQDQPTQIPAKLYECVGLGIPTLVIAEPMSAAAREADRIGAWTCDAQNTDAIASIIARIWLDRCQRPVATTPIGYDSIAREMDALLDSRNTSDGALQTCEMSVGGNH
jgi:glycosyltransferase involved in cell wall biosynthesis